MQLSRERTSGVAWCLAACFLWSLSGVYSRLVQEVDIPTAVVVRNASYGLAFSVTLFYLHRGAGWLRQAGSGIVLITGGISAISSVGYVGSLMLAPVANVLVIYAATPIFAALLARLLLGHRISPTTLLSIAGALAGVVMIFGDGIGSGNAFAGDGLAIIMTLATAATMVVMQKYPGIDTMVVGCITSAISILSCLPWAHLRALSFYHASLLVIYGLSAGLAFLCVMRGVRKLTSVEAGLISTLDVVIAPAWVFLAFGEKPSWNVVGGGTIIILAVLINLLAATRAVPAAA